MVVSVMDNLNMKIRDWAKEKRLDVGDPFVQLGKVVEELGELSKSIMLGDKDEQLDSVGDVYIAFYILTLRLGWNIGYCVESSIKEISDRKGITINGTFVKDSDLSG